MRAIILVGGFGTRLQPILTDVPKPMAPIDNKPFLAYLLDFLANQGITDVLFSVHYLREQIQNYFQSSYKGMTITYAIEEEPLGTGGAIANALSMIETDEPVFVLNGDTFVKLDYHAMFNQHQESNALMTMALRSSDDCCRYGKAVIEDKEVIAFKEKGEKGIGFINAGVYLINHDLFSQFNLPWQFSFEKDFLLPHVGVIKPQAFIANDYFIDIGVPDDYIRAKVELPILGFSE